jgi:Sec7-like guanine-nucleotide exchange factor
MDNKQIVKQMMDLHKAALDNSFSTMAIFHDQAEKLLKTFIDNNPGMGDEGRKVMKQWFDVYKKGRDDFKKAMDEGHSKIEAFLNSDPKNMFKDPNEMMFNNFLNQANWMPNDFKKATEDLTGMYKKGFDEFKKYADENMNHMKDFFSIAEIGRAHV